MTATLSPRELWIQALRSGKYKQGQRALCSDGRYCCLGVACEVYQEHVGDLRIVTDAGTTYYNDRVSILPIKVMKWLNLVSEYGENVNKYTFKTLVYLNDKVCCTFEDIANILEQNNGYFNS